MCMHVLYVSSVVMGSCLGERGGGREGGKEDILTCTIHMHVL